MKASYRWLRELLGTAFDAPASAVADRLTAAGLEVEATRRFGEASESVMVAEVRAREPHPSRAKLSLVTVAISSEEGGATQRVVCGAPNVPEPGGLVVLAPLGTHLPAKGLTLEPREIAGVLSEGMLCSEAELGLRISGGEAGILVLPPGFAKAGARLDVALPAASDWILEIGLTPNRPDGLGHVGLARELAALFDLPFSARAPVAERIDDALDVRRAVELSIEDEARCPSYGAALIEGVRVGPSPLGVQYRLEALGVRAISNVVDITNLLMLKYGHPVHGFDLDRVRKKTIVVRRAAENEAVRTLDGIDRKLSSDDLVIADGAGPVALAGVMGAEGSGIQDDTKRVLIECAYFTPRGVRRTARRHGMHSESSHRFERGVDPGDVNDVLAEAGHLLCSLAGGSAARELLVLGPGVPPRGPIRLRRSRMDQLLGVSFTMAQARATLERLGCLVDPKATASGEELSFIPPTHRPDLAIEADLIEEVIRVQGIDAVPRVIPAIRPAAPRSEEAITQAVVRAAIEVGLSQALTFAFTSPASLEALGAPRPGFVLANPLSDDRTVMRTSLLPGLLEALRRSRRHGVNDVRLFTTGARFLGPSSAEGLSTEARSFAAVIAGQRDAILSKPEAIDVFDAKGVAVAVVERATARKATVKAAAERPSHLHPRAAAEIFVDGRCVGTFGMIHPHVERALELDGPCAVVEIDIEALEALGVRTPRYRPIPALPAATRDIAFVVPDQFAAGDVELAIAEAAGDLAESVELFDMYRHESLGPARRSLAFHVVYRDPKAASDPEHARTLTDAEVDQRHANVETVVKQRFGAELRA